MISINIINLVLLHFHRLAFVQYILLIKLPDHSYYCYYLLGYYNYQSHHFD